MRLLPAPDQSAVSSRIAPEDRAVAILYLRGRLQREKAPARRRAIERELRELETVNG